MSIAVYNAVPMIINDGEKEHRFTLKLNPATDSFRLENHVIRRNIFIGKKMFNKLFQLIRNEYGFELGCIHYENEQMLNGSATTSEHEHLRFTVSEKNGIEVQMEEASAPGKKLTATVPRQFENTTERHLHLQSIIPSVLAAFILIKELHPAM